jgi:hypothetical protein
MARLRDLVVKQGTGFFHGAKHVFVALHPGQVAGPAAAFHVEAAVLLAQFVNDLGQARRAVTGLHAGPDAALEQGLDRGQVSLAHTHGRPQVFQVLGGVHQRHVAAAGLVHDVKVLGWKLVHHHAAVFAVGNLRHQRWHAVPGQGLAGQAAGLVPGLHLGHELGVRALGLDDGQDAGRLPGGVAAHQPLRQVRALQRRTRTRLLHRVLLHQHPAVAAVQQRAHEAIGHLRVVGQRHLRRRKTTHTGQGVQAERGGKVMLPGTHMQPEVLHRRGRRHRVAPGRAQPFNGAPVLGHAGDALEAVDHVVCTLHAQTVQQGARILQHHTRLVAFGQQRRHEVAHAGITVAEGGCVVVVADTRVFEHVLQVADQRCGAQVGTAGRDQRLVHVQGHGAGTADAVEGDAAGVQEHRCAACVGNRAFDQPLGPGQVGQVVPGLRQRAQGRAYLWRMNS